MRTSIKFVPSPFKANAHSKLLDFFKKKERKERPTMLSQLKKKISLSELENLMLKDKNMQLRNKGLFKMSLSKPRN
jgi:hypothetical protein